MALSRTDAATYVANTLGSWFTRLGIGTDDQAGELKEAIDEALVAIGTAWADVATATVADADVPRFLAALSLAAVDRLLIASAAVRDKDTIQGNGVTVKYADLLANLSGLRAFYAAKAAVLGVATTNSWQVPGGLSTDFLEPAWEVA